MGNKEILKKAYFQAARQTHPDHGGSVEDFVRVKDAYILLGKMESTS